jgi:LemA protein
MSIALWIVVAVVVAGALYGIVSYNGLVGMRQRCNQVAADLDVLLKQRHDLVPNLVETVKGYATHERGTLDEVVQARNAAESAQGLAAKARAETALSGALGRLFALAEAYPNLKANSNFLQLQADLTGIENRLADARRSVNDMVQGYNSMIQKFPTLLFAHALGFAPHEFFSFGQNRQDAVEAPQVRF